MEALGPADPQHVGRYRLVGRLGSGGMGQVYLGRSPGGRPVAVKLIRADLAESPDFRARFAQEVNAARLVSGIFTAPVVDADPEADRPWLVTAYVAAPSLADVVAGHGPLDADSVRTLAAGLAEGLSAIHAAGVVHRDLKPANVLLASDGPRIIDFGISRTAGSASLTSTGQIVGSPGFMSPEQAEGRSVGPPSDVFSLASVLVFAATGEGPFGSGMATAVLHRIVSGAPALAGLPGQLGSLIERCLVKDPARRPTAEVLLAELCDLPDSLLDLTAGSGKARAVASAPSPGPVVPGTPAESANSLADQTVIDLPAAPAEPAASPPPAPCGKAAGGCRRG